MQHKLKRIDEHVPVTRYNSATLSNEVDTDATQYYTRSNIVALVKHYHAHPKIQWKESIKRYMIELIRKEQRMRF